jgi:hypothetical protein
MQNHETKGQSHHSTGVTRADSIPDAGRDCKAVQAEAVAFVKRLAVATTTTFSGLERRSEPRILTNDLASMHVLNPLSEGRFTVRILDVSRNGMKLSAPMHLQRGTLVQIYIKNIVAMGEVRHCAKIDEEFHVGVCFDDVLVHQSGGEPWNCSLLNQRA